MVNYFKHPLDGCRERIRRGEEHLADFERQAAVVFEKLAYAARFDFDQNPPHSAIHVRLPSETFAGIRLGTLVGEICYNFRCALDYLVFALAELDSGSSQKNTQFPIMDTAEDFARGSKTRLKGISATHIAEIERLQPYMGCEWAGRLRDISNMDKHRHIVPGGGKSIITVHSSLEKDLSGVFGVERKAPHPLTGENVNVKVYIAGELTFDDESPALHTLHEIKMGVADTLRQFEPEF